MNPLPISKARSRLTKLADKLHRHPDAIEVTNRGKPVLAILNWDLYEAMEETIEILGDEDLQVALRKSLSEMRKGKVLRWEAVKRELRLK